MGSTRLRGKIFKNIGDKSLLEHIFFRLSFLKHAAKIVLATSTNPKDHPVEQFCQKKSIACFRGSEENVLERYCLCSRKYHFDHIVRLTADNPFTDIEELDRLIDLHLSTGADYSHSFGELPIGVGAEIFTFSALEKSYKKATKENHWEHVNEFIQETHKLFKIAVLSVPKEKNRPDVRLTVDTEEDYIRACKIIESAGNDYITTEKAVEICSRFA
jgi:spore coat polysaccharide biosynthesis protein SpsF